MYCNKMPLEGRSDIFVHSDNYIPANPLVTPSEIMPARGQDRRPDRPEVGWVFIGYILIILFIVVILVI